MFQAWLVLVMLLVFSCAHSTPLVRVKHHMCVWSVVADIKYHLLLSSCLSSEVASKSGLTTDSTADW